MEIRSLFSKKLVAEAERQSHIAHLLFDSNPELTRVFSHIAASDPVFYQRLFTEKEDRLSSWFVKPAKFKDGIQALALLSTFYSCPSLKDEHTALIKVIRDCLLGLEVSYQLDSESVSRKVAAHLQSLNPLFTLCSDQEDVKRQLQQMLIEQRMHWSLLVHPRK